MLEGLEAPSEWVDLIATMLAVVAVLTVRAPDGWTLSVFDPLDARSTEKLATVYTALRTHEDIYTFRT